MKVRLILQCVFVCVCKSDFVVTELLELIYVELLLSEFVREFTKK